MSPSLDYLESVLHKTMSSRFAAAYRLRLKEKYGLWGQVVSSIALVGWSVVPLFVEVRTSPNIISLFSVLASVYLLASSLVQVAARYSDTARSLEESARTINALRRQIHADIMAKLTHDAGTFAKRSAEYDEILHDNEVNHEMFDADFVASYKRTAFHKWLAIGRLHLKSGWPLLVSLVIVFGPLLV